MLNIKSIATTLMTGTKISKISIINLFVKTKCPTRIHFHIIRTTDPAYLCTNAVTTPPNAFKTIGINVFQFQYFFCFCHSSCNEKSFLWLDRIILNNNAIAEKNEISIVYKNGSRPPIPVSCKPFCDKAPANPLKKAAPKQGIIPNQTHSSFFFCFTDLLLLLLQKSFFVVGGVALAVVVISVLLPLV